MAKKYQQQTYTGSYSPAAQSLGFNPVKAIDESGKFKQKMEERDRDLKTYSGYLTRQATVANSQLQANRAKANANWAAVKGVLSLTQKGLGMAQEIEKANQIAALEAEEEAKKNFNANQALNAMADIGVGDITGQEAAQGVVDKNNDVGIQVVSEGQAINEAANEGDLTPGQQNAFRQSATQVAYTGVKGNVYSARDGHAAYIAARMDEIPDAQRPRTEAEAATLIRQFNADYLRESGVLDGGMTQELAMEKLPGTIMQNTANLAKSVVSAGIKQDQTANAQQLSNTLFQGVKSGISAQELWQTASDAAAFGNMGYNGRSAASNAAAIKEITAAYVANEDVTGLLALKDVPKIPGNPGAGTLGDAYGPEIDKAIEAARTGKVQEWNRGQNERNMMAQQMIQDYYEDPTSANREELIRNLRQLGPQGRAEADRIMKRGLNNDPELELQIASDVANGNPPSEAQLREYLDSGLIREEVYNQFKKDSETAQIDKQVAKQVNGKLSQIKGMIEATLPSGAVLSAVQKQEISSRAAIFQKDLEQRLNSEARAAGILDNPLELEKLTQKIMGEMAQEDRYKFVAGDNLGDAQWAAPITQDYAEQQALTVAPGQQDVRGIDTSLLLTQRVIPRSELSHIDDYILSQEDTLAAAAATDGQYSDRIVRLSKHLGISPKALVEGQLQRYNQPSLQNFQQRELSAVAPADQTDFTKATGYGYITNSLGFPARGAAYLTSAIDHESAWNGQREWGQVAGDGTNRNGGLISWASWSNDSARLGAIERFYGRSISQITEREQLDYMKREMQRSYGSAYRIFMDPNASSADLRWAVSRYWGFDPAYTGSRWTDAEYYIQHPPLQYSR